MTIGDRIKQRREQLGMTQEELAKKLGYASRSSVNKVEKSRELSNKKVKLYSDALKCTPAYLMGWDEETLDEIRYDLMADREAQQEKIYELMKNCFDDSSIYLLQAYTYLWDQYKNLLLQYTERLVDLQNADISTSLKNSERTRSNVFFEQMIANKKLTNAAHEKENISDRQSKLKNNKYKNKCKKKLRNAML